MAFETEKQTYAERKESLVATAEGKFAVIHGQAVIGKYDTLAKALDAGYDHCGLAPFLVKKILAVERTVVCRPW